MLCYLLFYIKGECMLKEKLKKYYSVMPFSIGTHCTQNREVVEKILCEGLKEYKSRELEGTLFMHGDLGGASESELTKSFLGNEFIVIVAVPYTIGFEAKPATVVGGNTVTNEFSALFHSASYVPQEVLPEFTDKDGLKKVPSTFILGYYDKKSGIFVENPLSMYSSFDRQKIEKILSPYISFLDKNLRVNKGPFVFIKAIDENLDNKYIKWKNPTSTEIKR